MGHSDAYRCLKIKSIKISCQMADDDFGKPKELAQGLSLKHLIKINSCSLFHFIIILPIRASACSSSSVSSVKNTGFFFSLLLFYLMILFCFSSSFQSRLILQFCTFPNISPRSYWSFHHFNQSIYLPPAGQLFVQQ